MRRTNPVAWLRSHPLAADALLAVGLLALAAGGLAAEAPASIEQDVRPDDWIAYLLVLLTCVPVAWRRRRPQLVLTVVGLASIAIEVLGYWVGVSGLGVLVGLYSVAAHTKDRSDAIGALVCTGIGISIVFAVQVEDLDVGGLLGNYALFATAWFLGDNLQTRRAYVRTLEERASLAEAGRAEEARRAVEAERVRIARELHDVVAHGVSVMVVQAGAARRTLDRDPAAAASAMASIESTGRQSLNELRRLLGMLREADPVATGRVPQPTIGDLQSLVEQTRAAGLPVELEVRGPARPLPAGVDLSAYRILQEALTNTLKHAGPARATVQLCYAEDRLELVVSDDGRGADGDQQRRHPTGHGIVGMEERVGLFGGELQVGNRPGGGFVVRAVLPLDRVRA